MIKFLMSNGVDGFYEANNRNTILQTLPFNSKRKMQSSCILDKEDPQVVWCISQGAPDYVMKNCTQMLTESGDIVEFDEAAQQ